MSLLKLANEAFRQKQYEAAIGLYVRALQQPSALPQVIQGNLILAQDRYLKSRQKAKPSVCISGWTLAQNAAGRVTTLAQLYQPLAEVNIIGCYFKKLGSETWAPLRNFPIPIHGIQVQDESRFIDQALELVLQHPCDLLHLSKPRFPNILIGALYKLIWNAHVVMDIDDEELAFVNATEPLSLDAWLKTVPNPKLDDLTGVTYTRLAVGLTNTFDGITVVNPALQKRYGGELVRHARDDKHFSPSTQRRKASRAKHGITASDKVIIFLGTPRQHKGLLEAAQAIASLKRLDVLFFIVGDFPDPLQNLKADIQAIPGLKVRFLGDQPFETIPDILALGDLCILLQDPDHLAAQYQTPAKLTDALAMGIPVLAEATPGLEDLAAKNAFTVVTRATLAAAIDNTLKKPATDPQPHPAYRELLTPAVNRQALQHILTSAKQRTATTALASALLKLLNHLPLGPGLAQLGSPLSTTATARPTHHLPAPAALSAPSSIWLADMSKQSSDAVIQKATDAMRQDDWSGAYECWKSLLTGPQETLNIDLLLRISQELFKLDAFTDATTALNQAAAKNPNHPGVLCEQADHYYYYCYSSWLMLVTENEPYWYKADGLDKRPDWQTACALIEKAEKVVPRNNLRRYVQAYLLLAEEAWNKHDRKGAHAALLTALKAIGPNKLNKVITAAIFQAVEQFREGKVDEKDPFHQTLQEQIKSLPLELLPVADWLCLNDILNWNGLLLCGYVAREKAVNLALAQGKANPNNQEILKTALKAALDRNDTALADDFLAKLKLISPDALDVRELDSCCELMKGNLEAFRQKWPHSPTPVEQHLREYLNGKTVAVVGPAPMESLDEVELDRYDVVVRINQREKINGMNLFDSTKRANITLFNAHTVRLLHKGNKIHKKSSFDYVFMRRPIGDLKNSWLCKVSRILLADYPGVFYKSQNSLQVMLFELIKSGCNHIDVYGMTFYASGKSHVDGYRGNVDSFDTPLNGLNAVIANHDLVSQFSLVKRLAELDIVRANSIIKNLIRLDTKNYLNTVVGINACKRIAPTLNGEKKRTAIVKKPPSKRDYYTINHFLKLGDYESVLDIIGNHGSKMQKALQHEIVWPHFETAREISPPSSDVCFFTIATIKFLPGLEVLVLSLVELYPEMTCDFYVYHDGSISEFAKRRLLRFYPNLIFVSEDPSKYDVLFSGEANHKRIGSIGYLNLEALRLDKYRRVVILDSDILVLKDISVLWDSTCSRPRVVMDAGIRSFGIVSKYTNKPIFNSGVISLPKDFLGADAYAKAIDCIKTLSQCSCEILNTYADQKFWNIFLSGVDVFYMPQNYNAIKTMVENFYVGQLAHVAILHFTGAKPWYFYSSRDCLKDDDIKMAKDTMKSHPITFGIWDSRVKELMCKYRKRTYNSSMKKYLDSVKNSAKGKKCLLIGNGPSLSRTKIDLIGADIKICFNWFVHHEDFDTIKPDHYILPSHQFFGGWHTYDPVFPEGFIEALLRRKHKPRLWFSYYFKEYVESVSELGSFDISYFLFEKPNKQHADQLGWMGLSLYDFLTDNRTGVLTVGVPLAIHLGIEEIILVGCDSNYAATKDDYFYSGDLHTSKSTNSESLINTWMPDGPGYECYKIADKALREMGIDFTDATVGGKLTFLKRHSARNGI